LDIGLSYQLFHDAVLERVFLEFWVWTDCATSTLAACQADQCPDTSAQSDNAGT
jgi:hypothetical protein